MIIRHNAAFIVCGLILLLGLVFKFFPFKLDKLKAPFVCSCREYFPIPSILLLLFYCLRGIDFSRNPYGIPECLTVMVTTILYIKKRNTILSFFSGLVVYMILATVYLS